MPTEIENKPSDDVPETPRDGGRGSTGTDVALLLTVLDSLVVGVLVLDGEGRVVLANQMVHETLGVVPGSLLGGRLQSDDMAGFHIEAEEIPAATLGAVDEIHEWWRDAETVGPQFNEVTRLRFRYETPDGHTRRGWISTRTVHDDQGEPLTVVSISDITAQEDEREQLRHLASTDVLTGLDNRAVLEEALDRYVAAAERTGQPSGSVLFIDLDDFKQVNDELGHGAGDRVLQIVGRRLRDAFRDTDVASRVERSNIHASKIHGRRVEESGPVASDSVAARYGGDEFVVLTDATDPVEIESLVIRVHDTITGAVELDGAVVQVEASLGWALIEQGSTIRSVLDAADRQVYEAKSLNRPSA